MRVRGGGLRGKKAGRRVVGDGAVLSRPLLQGLLCAASVLNRPGLLIHPGQLKASRANNTHKKQE